MCGIVGIFSHVQVAAQLYDSLIHLQHRGQDAAGIVTYSDRLHKVRGFGLVREVFNAQNLAQLYGNVGIGHLRYPTAGGNSSEEIQPFCVNNPYGICLAHNGNLINYHELKNDLYQNHNCYLNTSSDSEVLLHLFAHGFRLDSKLQTEKKSFFNKICFAVENLHLKAEGSYAAVCVIAGKGLVAFRDPFGIRPLVYSKKKNLQGGYDYIFASEPTMFHALGFTDVYDVKRGEVLHVDLEGNLHQKVLQQKPFSPCAFEYVYFARPDATLDDVSVHRARLRMGQNLAFHWQKTFPGVLPDVVIPAPATSNTAALAFAHELGVRYSEGLYKNPFIGRTFIMPDQDTRKRSVRYKLSPQKIEIENKKVLILDDSIVRCTTSKEIVKMIRECKAKEIYFVTACPPVKFPCFYGVDIPTKTELIAAKKSPSEIQDFLDVDKLLYQRIEDLTEAITRKGKHNITKPCMSCLHGNYLHDFLTKEKITELELNRAHQRQGNLLC